MATKHCTITRNFCGGSVDPCAVWSHANSLTIDHTICADNTPVNIDLNSTATLTSHGYNIFGDPSPSYALPFLDILTNDPKLEYPMRRGGPTYTCAFRPDSPACDNGNASHPSPLRRRG